MVGIGWRIGRLAKFWATWPGRPMEEQAALLGEKCASSLPAYPHSRICPHLSSFSLPHAALMRWRLLASSWSGSASAWTGAERLSLGGATSAEVEWLDGLPARITQVGHALSTQATPEPTLGTPAQRTPRLSPQATAGIWSWIHWIRSGFTGIVPIPTSPDFDLLL